MVEVWAGCAVRLKSKLCLYQCSPRTGSLQRYVWIDKFTLLFLGSLHCYCSLLSIFFASLTHTKYKTFIIFFDFLTNSLVRRPRSPLLSNRTPRASSSLYVSISSLSFTFSSRCQCRREKYVPSFSSTS